MTARILRRPRVEELTGLGRSAIYDYMARGQFPRPVQLSDKALGWIENEVSDWINARIAERDHAEKRRAGCDAELAPNAAPSSERSRLQSKPHGDDEISVEDRPKRGGQ